MTTAPTSTTSTTSAGSAELWAATRDDFFTAAMSTRHQGDPYPLYAAAREHAPIFDTGFGLQMVFTHGDVSAMLRSPRASSDERRGRAYQAFVADNPDPMLAGGLQMMLFMDPPDHTRLRGLVAQAFIPRRVEALRASAESTVAELLDEIAVIGESGVPVDLVERLAYPLPVRLICELLGVPTADHAQFGEWSNMLARSIDPGVLRTAEDEANIRTASAAFASYVEALLEDRRHSPGDDLLSAMVHAADGEDRLSHEELVGTSLLLLIAGHETTVNLIGNAVAALCHHPDQLALAVSRPDLDRSMINEALRWDSPVQISQRTAIEPIELPGATIPALDTTVLFLGAANRDPAMFPDPDRFDITRNAERHVSFGGGIHHCLGMALARMEGEVAVGALIRRFPGIALADGAVRRSTFTLRGYASLPVTISR